MKNLKKTLFTLLLFWSFAFRTNAQTNVSGGIYSDVTWTKANSPYIITDTIVVFPGVTLTIEAGVTVKFANAKYLEIRQASLIALGTVVDSITFTSNAITPTPGIYRGIVLTNPVSVSFDYLVFKYANTCVAGALPSSVTSLQHLSFYNNGACIYPTTFVKNLYFYGNGSCLGAYDLFNVDSCIFINNQYAVDVEADGNVTNCTFINSVTALHIDDQGGQHIVKNNIFCNNMLAIEDRNLFTQNDSILNCNFSKNHVCFTGPFGYMGGNIFADNDTALDIRDYGFDSLVNNYIYHNHVGILYAGLPGNISNNKICNNSRYNLQYSQSSNAIFANTCWCDTDSSAISAKIYDGYKNLTLGLVKFTPFINCDSSAITSLPPINCQSIVLITGVEGFSNSPVSSSAGVSPNPSSGFITLSVPKNNGRATVNIFNALGQLEFSSSIEKQENTLDVSSLDRGLYLIVITREAPVNEISRLKFIKQ